MTDSEKAARLVMVPVPAMGHLVSMVELAKRLLQIPSPSRRLSITVLVIQPLAPDPQLSSYMSAVSATTRGISFVDLPKIEPPVLDGVPGIEAVIAASLELAKPIVKSAIQALLAESPSVPVAAVVLDMFCANMIGVASDLEISPYVFFTSGAGFLSLMLYFPSLDAALLAEKDMGELHEEGYAIDLPGFSSPLLPGNLPNPLFYRKKFSYSYFIRLGVQFREAKGVLVNTFAELEPDVVKALEEHGLCIPDHPTPPIYPVGPVLSLNPDSPESEEHECIRWLNNQPPASVVFLCFGSMGSFQPTQVKEMAIALERSGHRFLWVLRCLPPLPPEKQLQDHPLARKPVDAQLEEVLPDGFLERTRGRGLVWPKFAPQKQILGHEAVGGFVTHCGWNSCLESLWFGVPMLGWPLYAEQHLNAAQMDREMGVAIALEVDREGENWATAEEVERGVRCLMENAHGKGEEVRAKALEMKEKGRMAVAEGGSSFLSLARWLEEATKELR